jgi:hypothetical protein
LPADAAQWLPGHVANGRGTRRGAREHVADGLVELVGNAVQRRVQVGSHGFDILDVVPGTIKCDFEMQAGAGPRGDCQAVVRFLGEPVIAHP